MAINKQDVQKFEESELWSSFLEIVKGRENVISEELLLSEEPIKIYRLQGAAVEIEFVRNLPNALITEIEHDQFEASIKETPPEEEKPE